jgi:RNA polymerase sigma factor (sigma-70 family)
MTSTLSTRTLSDLQLALLRALLIQKKSRYIAAWAVLMCIDVQMQAFQQAFKSVFNDTTYKFIGVISGWLCAHGLFNIDPYEILSEVWCRGVKTIYSGREIQKPTNWIWKVARNVVHEKGRKHTRDRNKLVENFNLEERLCADPDTDDHDALDDAHIQVRHALRDLEEDDRKILDMKFVQGLPWNAIGDSYGVTESTIRQRGCRALARLRKLLTANNRILIEGENMTLLHVYEGIVSLDRRTTEEDAFLDFVWELALLDDDLFDHLQQIEVKHASEAGFMSPEKTHFYRDQVAKFMEYGGLDITDRKFLSSESTCLLNAIFCSEPSQPRKTAQNKS